MSIKKRIVPIIIFALAAIVLILGIWQLLQYTVPVGKQVKDLLGQGYTKEDLGLTEFYEQTYIPQILSFVLTSFFFASVLASAGLISLKLGKTCVSAEDIEIFIDDDEDEDDEDEGSEDALDELEPVAGSADE